MSLIILAPQYKYSINLY